MTIGKTAKVDDDIQEDGEKIKEIKKGEVVTSGIPIISYFETLFAKYDATFVRLLAFQYFN